MSPGYSAVVLAGGEGARLRTRAAEDAGTRGVTLDDAHAGRDAARQSLYSGKAADARAQVVRTLVSQLDRLTTAIDEVDRAATALLPPERARHRAFRCRPAADDPRDRSAHRRHAARGARRAGALYQRAGTRRLRRLLPRDHRERPARRDAPLVASGLGHRPPGPLSRCRQCRPPECRVAHDLPAKAAQGKPAKQALIVVAVKLLHTLYAMLKHRRPYNPHASSSPPRRSGLDISWDVSKGMAGGAPHPPPRMVNSFVLTYRDRERERRAPAHLALHPDPAAMQFHELPAEGQPKPRPLRLLVRRPHLAELFEDGSLILGGDANARRPRRTRPSGPHPNWS